MNVLNWDTPSHDLRGRISFLVSAWEWNRSIPAGFPSILVRCTDIIVIDTIGFSPRQRLAIDRESLLKIMTTLPGYSALPGV